MNRSEAYEELLLSRGLQGVEPEALSTPALDAIISDLVRIRTSRRERKAFRYLKLYNDAGLLREALAADLAEWITAGFVAPDQAQSWQNARRRLEALTGIRHVELIDQLYADAALVLGAVDDSALLRVTEVS